MRDRHYRDSGIDRQAVRDRHYRDSGIERQTVRQTLPRLRDRQTGSETDITETQG